MPEPAKMETVQRNNDPAGAGMDLQLLAEQKEREWRHVQQLRIESLDAALKSKEKELQEERSKFMKLKEDFKYNLRLLNDRHSELEKYDSVVAEIKSELAGKDGEISELKVRIDELQTANQREIKAKNEMQDHYQRRIREKQGELEQYRVEKDAEINREREELEQVKRNLERQVREVEEEMDIQRQELSLGYEEAMRKREHEFRVQSDEMRGIVLSHELKVKVLQKELEQVKVLQQKSSQECEQTSEQHREVEKQLKHAQWEIQDVTAMKDAKIHELEAKLVHEEGVMKRLREDFKRKHDDMDRQVREKETSIAKVRESGQERERALQGTIRDLNKQLEDLQGVLRQSQWKQQDVQKENEATIKRLQAELEDMKSYWESHLSELSHETASKDVELETLRENEVRVKTELLQRKHDIERYQRELVAATERQQSLERAKAQVELDWQRRHEGLERSQFERSEDLVKALTQSRDEAQAEVKELKREVKQREDLISVMTTDRDNAIATLRQHGLKVDHNIKVKGSEGNPDEANSEVQVLQQQNDNLRAVISQMREDMESLGAQFPGNQSARGKQDSVTAEYVKNLEKEVQSLKMKNRRLEEALNDGKKVSVNQETDKALEKAENNMLVKAHVEQLNDVIGTLRSEKVEMAAQLRKMQTRLHHLETHGDQTAKQALQRQSEVEQAQYELNAAQRRHTAEITGLQQRIADLELQLSETRKEADEYYKANIQRNLEVTALGNELSALKLELAQKRQPINFGAQELLIQQLEDEISQLRKQERGEFSTDITSHNATKHTGVSGTITDMQKKLKQAARHISQLAREKQQLIEVGNRQRAQLLQAGLRPASPPTRQPIIRPSNVSNNAVSDRGGSALQEKIHSKLQQLESLQYQLTKQKLAHQSNMKQAWIDTSKSSETTSSEKEENDQRPPSVLKKISSSQPPLLSPVPEDRQPSTRHTAEYDEHPVRGDVQDTLRPTTADSELTAGYLSARDQVLSGRMTREQFANVMMSMSSAGGESLQEIWKMLDEDGISPRITPMNTVEGPFTGLQFPGEAPNRDTGGYTGHNWGNSPASSDSWTVKGAQAPVAKQSTKQTKKYQPQKSIGKPIKTQQKQRIRNYNVKDDTHKR